MYCSAPHLVEFYERVSASARSITDDYELVLVNDGSPDNSLAIALSLCQADGHVKVIDLSRNFGHHPAITSGLEHATGDWVFLIDCDLEESPELLHTFRKLQDSSNADVIFGVQDKRRGKILDRWCGALFYKLYNLLAQQPIPENVMMVRLMSRRYVDAFLSHKEVEVVLAGLMARTGFQQLAVPVCKTRKSTSTYTLSRKLSLGLRCLTAFSNAPLLFVLWLGCAICIATILGAMALLVDYVYSGPVLTWWPFLLVSVWLLAGLIIFCQGIIGIYLAKVFSEVKRRPLTVVRQIYQSPACLHQVRPIHELR
jgi:putative glycosyltransferase